MRKLVSNFKALNQTIADLRVTGIGLIAHPAFRQTGNYIR